MAGAAWGSCGHLPDEANSCAGAVPQPGSPLLELPSHARASCSASCLNLHPETLSEKEEHVVSRTDEQEAKHYVNNQTDNLPSCLVADACEGSEQVSTMAPRSSVTSITTAGNESVNLMVNTSAHLGEPCSDVASLQVPEGKERALADGNPLSCAVTAGFWLTPFSCAAAGGGCGGCTAVAAGVVETAGKVGMGW